MHFKWLPHPLASDLKRKRVRIAKELFHFLENASVRPLATVFTADESWFYWSNPRSLMWTGVEIPTSARLAQMNGATKWRYGYASIEGVASTSSCSIQGNHSTVDYLQTLAWKDAMIIGPKSGRKRRALALFASWRRSNSSKGSEI
jgi:hypothetical protein